LFFLPWNNCAAFFLRTTKPLETSVKAARLDQSPLDPELAATLGASQTAPSFHFLDPGQQAFPISSLHQMVEFLDSGWPADEKLNPARVTDNVRFVLLGLSDIAW